jgi:NAD(P)H-nitrite reductase large subunit
MCGSLPEIGACFCETRIPTESFWKQASVMSSSHLVIVGMGVASMAAAESIRSIDSASEVTLISQDPHGYYSLPGLAYFLAKEVPQSTLKPYSEADYRQLNLRRISGQVIKVEPSTHCVFLDGGERLSYDRLLLATGSKAVLPDISGVPLAGVVTLDNLEDALGIAQLCKRVKIAVVVGGGITALEIVEGLIEQGLKVHYFLRGIHYWSNVLNETESEIVETRLQEWGVKIHINTELAEICGEKGKVSGIVTRSGERINCGMVGIAIGVLPRKELAEMAGLKTERGILVDEYLQTSQPDILSAGDAAQVFDPLTQKSSLDTLWWVAREQGRVAGLNLAGIKTLFQKPVSSNMTRLTGINTNIIGSVGQGKDRDMVALARGDSDSWRNMSGSVSIQAGDRENHIRLQLSDHTLTGAVVMGDQSLSNVLRDLIADQVDITAIKPLLLGTHMDLKEILTGFYSQWRGNDEGR